MQGLWKKVNKGTYERIPSRYSDDLAWLINQCLKLTAADRPSCDAILKSPQVRKRIHLFPNEEFNKDNAIQGLAELENQRLLETIKAPPRGHNFKQIKDRLPRSNYNSKDK
jgi:NIMA (never in mitosis gene a)-related kinase